jgi:hypothetical protein
LKTKIEIVRLDYFYKVSSISFKVFSPSYNISLQTSILYTSTTQLLKSRVFSHPPFKMMFTLKSAFLLALTLSTSTFALPTAQPEASDFGVLETRASAKPRVLVSCNGVMITTDYINTAMTQARALATVAGGQTAYYPEGYGNNDGPLFAATGQLYSFPVMSDGSAWNCKFYLKYEINFVFEINADYCFLIAGTAPGPYRVVMDVGYRYQGTMVHVGTGGGFTLCG